MQQVLYGGTRDGRPVGGARFYLGAEFIDRCVPKRRVAVVGGREGTRPLIILQRLTLSPLHRLLASLDSARYASSSPRCTACRRVPGRQRLLRSVFVLGGGAVALEEVQYADQQVGGGSAGVFAGV